MAGTSILGQAVLGQEILGLVPLGGAVVTLTGSNPGIALSGSKDYSPPGE